MKKLSGQKLRLVVAISLAAFILGAAGCGSLMKKSTIGAFGGPMVKDMMDLLLDSQSARLLKDAMPGNVVLITAAAEMGQTRDLYEVTCFLYTSYGIMVEDDDPEYALELYNIGRDYGLRALMTDRDFKKGYDEGKKIPELVDVLDERYTASLAWCGMATGLLIIHQMDDPMALMGLPDAVSMVKRSVTLDEKYFYGVGKTFLGAYYALMPEFLGLGGGPEASAEMFDEARAISDGKFLLVDVFEARYLMTYIDDRAGFEALLTYVLEADASALEGGTVLNKMAKVKAEYYLSIEDQLF